MRILITYLFCLFATAVAVAQVSVTGKVIDKENNEPLAGASVIVRGADGKIKEVCLVEGRRRVCHVGGYYSGLPSGGVGNEV